MTSQSILGILSFLSSQPQPRWLAGQKSHWTKKNLLRRLQATKMTLSEATKKQVSNLHTFK